MPLSSWTPFQLECRIRHVLSTGGGKGGRARAHSAFGAQSQCPTTPLLCYAQRMGFTGRQLLHFLNRTPFVDSAELALILGEPHATIHRALADLMADGIVGRVSHGTAHLPSSQRYHLTASGILEAAGVFGFDTPSDFVRAYPVSREWLALLIRRMDAVAAVYRLAALMSPGTRSRRSHVEFHRRGRFDATITLHDGRSFGVVRQGLVLRRRSLYDRLRAIAEYDYTRRPDAVLVLTPSNWEERLTSRFCERLNLDDCFVAVESRDALERRGTSPLAQILVGRQLVPYAERRERPRQPRRSVLARRRRSGSVVVPLPASRADGADYAGLRRQPELRSGRSTLSPTTR